MFIVIKSEHYDCTNLICKKDTLEEAVAAVKDSMAQRINKNYHAGLTGTDITHENEDHYGFSFTFDENRNADSSEPRAYSTYDYWNGDDQESVEWVVYEVTTDKPFFLLSYDEYESIELTGFYDSFDEAFEEMKELIAESVNDVFDEDATADDVEDMEDYNVFVHSNKDSQDNGAEYHVLVDVLPKKTVLEETIYVSKPYAERIKKYLRGAEVQGDGSSLSKTAKFSDGFEMDIRCCGGKDDSWTEAILYDDTGREVAVTEPCDGFTGCWELKDEDTNTVYRAHVMTKSNLN